MTSPPSLVVPGPRALVFEHADGSALPRPRSAEVERTILLPPASP